MEVISCKLIVLIHELWEINIADFEKHEQDNDSKNQLLSKAREDARMTAYVNLMEHAINEV